MANENDQKHDRRIETLIASGLIALKRALQALFILRMLQLTTQQTILESDRRRVIAILESELTERVSYNGPVYQAVVNLISKAGPDIVDYEVMVPDDFGLILTARLERAKRQLITQADNALLDAVIREASRSDASTEVFNILSLHSGFKRVMAYDTARAYNLQLMSEILGSNLDYIRIQLSEEHDRDDICDHLVGVFPISEITGEPFRRIPPFHPFCKCYVLPFRS